MNWKRCGRKPPHGILTSESESSLMLRPTIRRPVCLGIKNASGAYDQIFITVRQLLMWGALSDERTGLPFKIAAGPRQRSHSRVRVRVPWDSRPYFTVSDSRLPFSSPPTTRRVTVEVFDPASKRNTDDDWLLIYDWTTYIVQKRIRRKQNRCPATDICEPHTKYLFLCCIYSALYSNGSYPVVACVFVVAGMCLPSRCPATGLYVTISIKEYQ
jgi:hypothetical protein